MIIGNGLLAKSFEPYFGADQSVIVFASGVSNSRETNNAAFLREAEMLQVALSWRKKLLYFSTCSIEDTELQSALYVLHKKNMEAMVRAVSGSCIFRLPQVVGKTSNPHTLTNYLHHQIISGTNFQIWQHAKRNLIDVDDVAQIVNYFVRAAQTPELPINIASPFSISIPKLVKTFEVVLGTKANFTLIEAGGSYEIQSELTQQAASELGISFDDDYIERLIRKYYE